MELSLVPIEGEEVVSERERERVKRRAREIPAEELSCFDDVGREQIKQFLTSLITLSERLHHDMEESADGHGNTDAHEEHIEALQAQRVALFDAPPPAVVDFIELLLLYPMEPWSEFELMIAGVRGEDMKRYYETKLNAAVDTGHIDAEGDVDRAQEERMEAATKTRITPLEIEDLVQSHSLESLVKHLIHGRRLVNGAFWDLSHYDL